MLIQQLSIFLENKSGRLTEITKAMGKANINMSAFSMSENSDFGILRLIVNNPEEAQRILRGEGFAVNLTQVVCLECSNRPGALAESLELLSQRGVFIDYMYAFSLGEKAHVVLRTADPEQCAEILSSNGKKLLSPEDLK